MPQKSTMVISPLQTTRFRTFVFIRQAHYLIAQMALQLCQERLTNRYCNLKRPLNLSLTRRSNSQDLLRQLILYWPHLRIIYQPQISWLSQGLRLHIYSNRVQLTNRHMLAPKRLLRNLASMAQTWTIAIKRVAIMRIRLVEDA